MPLGTQIDCAFWVPNPAGDASVSFFLTRARDGSFRLLDADESSPRPVRLALKPQSERSHFGAYISHCGMLRIVEAPFGAHITSDESDPEFDQRPLLFHTVCPISGDTIATKRGNGFWKTELASLQDMYHPKVHRVASMVNKSTIAIIEADTLDQKCCLYALCSPEIDEMQPFCIATWRWSHNGQMAAMELEDKQSAMSVVQIYDTESGQLLHSLQRPGQMWCMSWSSSLDKLVVSFDDHSTDLGESSGESSGEYLNGLYVLDPALQTTITSSDDPDWTAMKYCRWTPCGTLLELKSMYGSRIFVLDPCTLQPLWDGIQGPGSITWGSIASAKNMKETIIAWMPDISLQVIFWHANGEWHTQSVTSQALVDLRRHAAVEGLAAGRHCIFVDMSTFHVEHGINLYQHDFRSSQPHVITKHLDRFAYSASAASPWPGGWSSMYVNVHVSVNKPASPSVVLVDAQRHRVVGRWSGRALGLKKAGRLTKEPTTTGNMCEVIWSQNGRHIAVKCRGVVFVLVF